jgi:hypothetical protein
LRGFSTDVTSWIEVKWLKGILIDRMIKGFESQEKPAFRIS